jgi:hypothetical protein
MFSDVTRPRFDAQVFRSVVSLVAVDVVDDFVSAKRAPKQSLHDSTVLAFSVVCPPRLRGKLHIPV